MRQPSSSQVEPAVNPRSDGPWNNGARCFLFLHITLVSRAGRHKDAAKCDAQHVDAELVDHPKASGKACRVLNCDALKNAHPLQLHVEEGCPSGKCTNGNNDSNRPGPTPCQPEQSLLQISQALKLHLELQQGVICCRLAVAEDRKQLSVDWPVAFPSPRSCLGTQSKEIPTGLHIIVLRVVQRETRVVVEAFKFGLMADSPHQRQISGGASEKGTRCSWQESQTVTLCGNPTCGRGVVELWARLRPHCHRT